MNDLTPEDDLFRRAMSTVVADTPVALPYDQMLDRAAGRGVVAPAWADDRYDEPVGATMGEAAMRSRRRRLTTLIASILAVGALSGGGYLAYAEFVGPDGYDSPIEAVEGFLGALEEGNLLKASRALAPYERDSVEQQLAPALETAREAGLLTDNDIASADHVSLERVDLVLEEIQLSPGVSRVEAASGSLVLATDDELFGDATRERFLDPSSPPPPLDQRVDLAEVLRSQHGRAGLVTVEDGGKWYVSLSHTILDGIRLNEPGGVAPPDLTAPVDAEGAADPTEAAATAYELLSRGSGAGDLLSVVDPVTGVALHRYRSVLDDQTQATTDGSDLQTKWSIAGTGDRRVARLQELRTDGEMLDGNAGEVVLTPAQRCADESGNPKECDPLLFDFVWDDGIALIERDGRWYVDPITGSVDIFLEMFTGHP